MLERTMLSVLATPDVAGIRTAQFRDQEHTVIPVVALVEGVLWPANAPGPELALAEEFGRFPEGWDGSPIVFDHPRDSNGAVIPANSPDVLEDNAFGQMFNTVLEDGKLKSEMWVDNALVANLSEEARETIAKLIAGESIVEVSTGLFMMSERATGEFEGQRYEGIWRNIVPDHLAILPEGVTGACSVKDGCGAPRSNDARGRLLTFTTRDGEHAFQPAMRAAVMNSNCHCDDSVTISADDTQTAEQQTSLLKRIMQMAGTFSSFRDNSEGISDRDLRVALDIAIGADENDFIFIMAVFQDSDNAGTVVYEKGFGPPFFERNFTMNDDGGITLGEDKTAVRPETKFVPITITGAESDSTIQENAMHTKEQLINELIANKAVQFAEEDREWLGTLEDAQLAKLSPVDNADGDAASADAEASANANANADANAGVNLHPVAGDDDAPVSTEDYIADAPAEVQEVLNAGLSMHRARKESLVTALIANSRCRFSKEQLEAKQIPELENLASLAVDISYEGSGANLHTLSADDDAPPKAPQLFDLNAHKNAANQDADAA